MIRHRCHRRPLTTPIQPILILAILLAAPAVAPAHAQEASPASDDANVIVDPSLLETLQYRLVGPTRGGRSTAVTGVPGQPHTFYMGTTGGGVWKTETAGLSWNNVSDDFFGVGSIGAVQVAPSDPNVVYVGTGSACPRGNVSVGDGVYRSTDAGRTWSHVGLEDAGQIGRVRVDPRDPDRVYVAVLGHVFGPSEQRGVFRSRDGGASWEKVLYVSDGAGAVDLAMDPANPRVLFAAIWRVERKPWTLIDGGEDSGLYRSIDGGDSWERLGGGLPDGVVGRVGVTVSAAKPGRVWALVTAEGDRGGIYRSDDGGDSWRRLTGYRELRTRGWYYAHIVADPTDANTVYVMNGGFYRSIDGGTEWQRVRTPHGDNHDLWINPDDGDLFIEANDGGAAVTLDGGGTWTTQLNQPTAEFYRVTVDDQFPYRIYGAQQDNSTISVSSAPGTSTAIPWDWYAVGGGESGYIAVKPGDPSTVFAGNYIGRIDRFDLDSGHSTNVVIYPQMQDGTAPKDLRYRFQWNAPILFSRHDPDVLYHTSNFVHRSTDGGQSWETISPDLTTDNPEQQELPGGPIQHDHTGVEVYNTIFALAESPFDAAELWTGSDDGRVHVTRDGGATWIDVTPEALPAEATVNTLELSARAPGRAYLAAYRYRLDDFHPYVFRTDDWGASWVSLADGDNGIPGDHPVRVVREDPVREGLLYAGTEFGMFASFDAGAHWQSLQRNLPVTPVTDLVVFRDDLVVATQGRSFWVLDDLPALRQVDDGMLDQRLALLQPDDAVRWAGRRGFFGAGDGVSGPDYGAVIQYRIGDDVEGDVKLEILDADGAVVRTFEGEIDAGGEESEDGPPRRGRGRDEPRLDAHPGMNRFVWDLTVEGPDTVEGARFSLANTGDYPVVPGDYTVRLTAGELTDEATFAVLPDPRMDAGAEDLAAQFALQTEAKELLEQAHDAVRTLRSVRDQARAVTARATEAGIDGDWETRRDDIVERLSALEDDLIQHRSEASQDSINFPPRLDDQIAYLYSHVGEGYGRPTAGAYQRYADLREQLAPLRGRLQAILEGPVADLNQALRDADAAGILLPVRE